MAKRVYFIGIGGISMSSLAVFLSVKGNEVCGSDLFESENLKGLKNFNISYNIGHKKENIEKFNPNLVVINCAIHEENEELKWARANNKKVVSRAEMLGKISKDFKNVIAISGTHGKTTTTAIIAEIFMEACLRPTVHIGGILKKSGSNFLIGEKKFFITEACEYQNSFLSLSPTVGIVLNIEPDHLDFFKNIEEINESFEKFLSNSKTKIYKKSEFEYVLKNSKNENIYYAMNLRKTQKGIMFDLHKDGIFISSIQTPFFGAHNIKNSVVACAVALHYKIKLQTIKKAIKNFHGVKRRFEQITKLGNAIVIHDYAHHPTEIAKTITQAKQYGKVLTVFQPHTFSRTKSLLNNFLTCFNDTDGLLILKTYPARETETEGTSAKELFEKLISENPIFKIGQINQIAPDAKISYLEQKFQLENYVQNEQRFCKYSESFCNAKAEIFNEAKNYDCVLILGAGDINELARMLKKERKNYLKQS